MPSAASLTGLMCRMLLLTSVAYEDTGQMTVELSTPRFVAPTSMMFCFTSTNFNLTRNTVTVVSLSEGGSIFSSSEAVVAARPIQLSRFFSSGSFDLDPMEVSTVSEVLGTDPYYAKSYKLQRYDDLVRDQQGVPIRGVAGFPEETAEEAGIRYEQYGNCFTLTGAWKQDMRYQLTIQVKNPPAPPPSAVPVPPPPPMASPPPSPPASNTSMPPSASPPATPGATAPPPSPAMPPPAPSFMLVSNNATPILWVMPLTYSIDSYGSGVNTVQTLLFSVRGDKYGAACALRPAIVPVMGSMFDACTESRKLGLGPPEGVNTTVRDCLNRLRLVAGMPANQNVLPFTAPPLRTYSLSSFGQATCPTGNIVLGPRLGGECISCGQYGVKGATTCTCPGNILPNKVGSVACGDPITPDGNVTSLSALPQWLCQRFGSALQQWRGKDIPAHNVATQYQDLFLQLARPILDRVTIAAAYETFQATLIFDDRKPDSPTRRLGLKPNCNKCTDGEFKDTFTSKKVPLFDWSFDAMNTFRFIGYLLDQALGWPCQVLWDSAKPRDWNYGYYEEVVCKLMPEGTCCGSNFKGNPAWVGTGDYGQG